MVEPEDDSTPDSATPSAYTYFGQFIDHDITFEAKSDSLANLSDPDLEPLPLESVAEQVTVVFPSPNREPEAGVQITFTLVSQLSVALLLKKTKPTKMP